MKKDLISVIVPVYNVEKYLSKCIESIISQTYTNLELVLIDDGSKDDSFKICEKYAKIDNRIKLFHKENGGLSDARNYGLKYATGNYITFIDSDDFIDEKFLEILYNIMVKNNSDIAVSKLNQICLNDKIKVVNIEKMKVNTLSDSENIIKLFLSLNTNFACGKMFKSEVLSDFEFKIDKYYEDIWSTYKLFFKAKSVSFTSYNGYFYLLRDNSITGQASSRKIIDGLDGAIERAKDINNYYDSIEIKKQNRISFYNIVVTFLFIAKRNSCYEVSEYIKKNRILNKFKFTDYCLLSFKNKIKYIFIKIM